MVVAFIASLNVTVTAPEGAASVAPGAGARAATVGAMKSGGGVKFTVSVSLAVWLEKSRATTVMTLAPAERMTFGADQAAVPDAVPEPPRSLDQVTCETPRSSAATPPRASTPLDASYVSPLTG